MDYLEAEELVVERTECDAASLTTLTKDNFVVIDDQAPQVLNAQVQKGALYGIYCATKSLVVSPPTVSPNDKSYDTSKWEDVNEHDQDYIDARHAAEEVIYYCDEQGLDLNIILVRTYTGSQWHIQKIFRNLRLHI